MARDARDAFACGSCDRSARREYNCGHCEFCCPCHGDLDVEYDADELGLDPELDVESRVQSLNERAARNLLRRPRYPGEIVHGEPVWGHDQ